jgi:hypothetical protein
MIANIIAYGFGFSPGVNYVPVYGFLPVPLIAQNPDATFVPQGKATTLNADAKATTFEPQGIAATWNPDAKAIAFDPPPKKNSWNPAGKDG